MENRNAPPIVWAPLVAACIAFDYRWLSSQCMWWLFTARTAAFNLFFPFLSFFFFKEHIKITLAQTTHHSISSVSLKLRLMYKDGCVSGCFFERRLKQDLKACNASNQPNLWAASRHKRAHTCTNPHTCRLSDNQASEGKSCSVAGQQHRLWRPTWQSRQWQWWWWWLW